LAAKINPRRARQDLLPGAANQDSVQPVAPAIPSICPPGRAQLQVRVPESGESRRIRSVLARFRPDSRLSVKKCGLSGCHGSAFALLHSQSAFGIALALTASDRRHKRMRV